MCAYLPLRLPLCDVINRSWLTVFSYCTRFHASVYLLTSTSSIVLFVGISDVIVSSFTGCIHFIFNKLVVSFNYLICC